MGFFDGLLGRAHPRPDPGVENKGNATAARATVPREEDDVERLLAEVTSVRSLANLSPVTEKLIRANGKWKGLAARERDRRKKKRDAEARIVSLLERLAVDDSRLKAIKDIYWMAREGGGSDVLDGDARARVVTALRDILTREKDFDLRKAAYDALKALGEKVSATAL